jgi:hypothetical protein
MRKLVTTLLATGLAFGLVGQASASTIDLVGSITVGFGSVPPVTGTTSGWVSISTPVGSPEHIAGMWTTAGLFALSGGLVPITDPSVSANLKAAIINLTGSSGQFAENSSSQGGWGGVQGSTGITELCLLADPNVTDPGNPFCPLPLFIPSQQHQATSVIAGAGLPGAGQIVASASVPFNISVSVKGDAWYQREIILASGAYNASRTHTANEPGYGITAFTVNAQGFIHGPASLTASSTGVASGVMQLITPLEIMVSLGGSTFVPGFSILKIHFVPEPGTLLLIGSGIAGVVLLGRKRMKK